jgi:hypothetical protein
MERPDEYQVSTAKWLIQVMILHCLQPFPRSVVIEAFKRAVVEMEQEAIAHAR